MSLKIGYSNIMGLFGGVPNFSFSGTSSDDLANLIDPDHSTTFTATTSGVIDFGELYPSSDENDHAICISGISSSQSLIVKIYHDTTLIDQATINTRRSGACLFFTFSGMSTIRLKVDISEAFTLSYIAMAKVNNNAISENAGYARNHYTSHKKTTTTTNLQSAPVSTLTQNKQLKGSLSLPNADASTTDELQRIFYDPIFYGQPFFIREDDSNPVSSYCCFDPVLDVRAHSQTVALNNVKLGFKVFNGGF